MIRSAAFAVLVLILLGLLLIIGIVLIVLEAIKSTPGSEEAVSLNSQTIIGRYEQTLAVWAFLIEILHTYKV